jgi:hypothetical protein
LHAPAVAAYEDRGGPGIQVANWGAFSHIPGARAAIALVAIEFSPHRARRAGRRYVGPA